MAGEGDDAVEQVIAIGALPGDVQRQIDLCRRRFDHGLGGHGVQSPTAGIFNCWPGKIRSGLRFRLGLALIRSMKRWPSPKASVAMSHSESPDLTV